MGQHTNDVELLVNQGWGERILVCSNGYKTHGHAMQIRMMLEYVAGQQNET